MEPSSGYGGLAEGGPTPKEGMRAAPQALLEAELGEELLKPMYELFGIATCFQVSKLEPVIQSRDWLHTELPPFAPQRLWWGELPVQIINSNGCWGGEVFGYLRGFESGITLKSSCL